MKGIAGLVITAIVLAAIGAICLSASRLDRDLARAQEDVVAGRYDEPAAAFDAAQRYYEYGTHLPGVSGASLNEIRARRAALDYWRKDYDAVVPQQTDPVAAVPADATTLQLVVANAVFRRGEGQAKDKASLLQAIDAGINAYQAVLKNADRQDDAAYNYEYLVRLRDEVDKGKHKPGGEPKSRGPEGAAGAPPTIDSSLGDFKIYIPLESNERQDNGAAGKAAPIKRKG